MCRNALQCVSTGKMKFGLSVCIVLFLASPLFGMHEMDHRYTVLGYVRNEQGEGKTGIAVTVEHKGGEKQQTKTDSSGYYEILFHLHNANLGDEMIITAGTEVKTVVTAFDPEDKFADRKSQVDFGAKEKEQPLRYWLVVGGVAVLLCGAIYFSLIKKKRQSVKRGSVPRGEKRKK